jgi:two-component system, NarL family, sensor histidine kinase UhpB
VTASLNFTGRHAADVETTAYRIIQEALTNAIKHAGATSVHIGATEAEGVVNLQVIDDGGGFDPSAPRTGFGLTGMRERALLLGGDLEVTSTADGTCVSARLPTGPRP